MPRTSSRRSTSSGDFIMSAGGRVRPDRSWISRGCCRFHRHTLHLLLEEGRLRMLSVRVGARMAAVFYGLASGRWWGYYLAAFDREWAGRIHLGQITLAAAIEAASAQRAAEFDFLKGADRIRYLW